MNKAIVLIWLLTHATIHSSQEQPVAHETTESASSIAAHALLRQYSAEQSVVVFEFYQLLETTLPTVRQNLQKLLSLEAQLQTLGANRRLALALLRHLDPKLREKQGQWYQHYLIQEMRSDCRDTYGEIYQRHEEIGTTLKSIQQMVHDVVDPYMSTFNPDVLPIVPQEQATEALLQELMDGRDAQEIADLWLTQQNHV